MNNLPKPSWFLSYNAKQRKIHTNSLFDLCIVSLLVFDNCQREEYLHRLLRIMLKLVNYISKEHFNEAEELARLKDTRVYREMTKDGPFNAERDFLVETERESQTYQLMQDEFRKLMKEWEIEKSKRLQLERDVETLKSEMQKNVLQLEVRIIEHDKRFAEMKYSAAAVDGAKTGTKRIMAMGIKAGHSSKHVVGKAHPDIAHILSQLFVSSKMDKAEETSDSDE